MSEIKTTKKKSSSKLLYIIGGIAIGIVILGVVAKKSGWIGGEKGTEVILEKAKKVEIVEKVSASGKVQPETEVKIAPLVSGEVIEVLIKEGDSVRVGQILAKIKPDNLKSALERVSANLSSQRANLSQTKATLEQSKAQFIRAKADFERNKSLFAQKMISQAEMDGSTASFQSAQADLESATQRIEAARFNVISSEATVNEANQNLSFTVITAPMSGIVTKLNVEVGERVVGTAQMAGTEMLRIADLRDMEVRVDVNENDIIRVSLGDTAIVEVDSYSYQEKKFKGVVTLIANSAKEGLTSSADAITEFQVRIRILRDSYNDLKTTSRFPFRPGMTASVDIITERKTGVLAVPLAAVTTRTKAQLDKENKKEGDNDAPQNTDDKVKKKANEEIKEIVFINDNGKAKIVEVKTSISDLDNIQIVEGLKEGDEVIVGPFIVVSQKLKNGEKLEIKKEEDAKKDEKPKQ